MNGNTINEIGTTYNSWTILSFFRKNGQTYYKCACVCGKQKDLFAPNVRFGKSKSCGCMYGRFGHHKTSEYAAWREAKYRCGTKTAKAYPSYGGRGIKVCDRWKNSFLNFFEDMGKRPSSNHSLDRIDNNGDYSPENCKWSTRKEQMNNTRQVKHISHGGRTLSLAQWSEVIGVKYKTFTEGIRRGCGIEYYLKKYESR